MGFYTPTERAGIYIDIYKLLNTVQLTIAFAQNEYTTKKKNSNARIFYVTKS